MRNIPIRLDVEQFKNAFYQHVASVVGKSIRSYYLFGGLARGEPFTAGSDIDAVLLINKASMIGHATMTHLGGAFAEFQQAIGTGVDNVIVTQDDIFELLSPILIRNMYDDGVTIYGQDLKPDFKQYLNAHTERDLLNSQITRTVFRRHTFRKRMIRLMVDSQNKSLGELQKEAESMSKDVLFTALDFIFFSTNENVTKRDEIHRRFFSLHPPKYRSFPQEAHEMKNHKSARIQSVAQYRAYAFECFKFIEQYVHYIEHIYKDRTGESRLNLKTY